MSSRGNLYRSQNGKILGGVCSGLGEYFDIDPVIFRVIFILLMLVDWVGFLAYIILWIVLPIHPRKGPIKDVN